LAWLGTWANRLKISISNTVVDATLTDFPVMVKLSTASGIGDVDVSAVFDELASDANRKKIAVTSSDGTTQLYCEIEKWDDANEEAWLHVKVPSVSSSAATDLYLYYDSAQADNTTYIGDTTDAVTHNVWDSSFKAIYHMAQDPNGDGVSAIKDSTVNANEGTPFGSMVTADLVDGQVGKGIEFAGSQGINCGTDSSLDLDMAGAYTVSAVVKSTSTTASMHYLLSKIGASSTLAYFGGQLNRPDEGKIQVWLKSSDGNEIKAYTTSATVWQNGSFHHLTIKKASGITASTISVVVDGVDIAMTEVENGTFASNTPSLNHILGGIDSQGSVTGNYEGILDEVRVSDIERSAPWVKATYHSLWDSLVTFAIAVEVSATTATLTITANAASINIPATSASLTITANAATVNVDGDVVISATTATLTIVEYNATVSLDVEADGTTATLTATGQAANIALDLDIQATTASLTTATFEAEIPFYRIITETSQIYDTLKWFWELTPADGGSTAAITDVAEADLGLNISEWLNVEGELTNNWAGTENVTSTLGLFGQSMIVQIFNDEVTSTAAAVEVVTYLHQMISIANSTFAAADTSSAGVEFNPTVAESIAVSGLLSAIHTLNLSISESGAIVDTLGFAWMDTVAETFAIVDAPTIQWVAMHILTESIVATDTAVGLFNFTDTVTETLAIAAALTLQQTLQDSIEEILNFGITIRLDDEVWECWVLNTNQFHPSVYSGFDFNSYAVYNNQAFGCREDGIYRLDGTTDNGTTINAGIVLPETDFGTLREKRFRKAYFGISGTSPSIRMETDTANVTYTISSSKANIQRNQKGKDWTLKVSGYDDMDFIELVPIILTR
jgi:hypothetical protein